MAYDELDLLIELRKNLPIFFPFIKTVESYTKYNGDTLKSGDLTCYVQFMDTRRHNISSAMISDLRLVLAVKNDTSGDYAMIKTGKIIADNISKIHSNNVRSILITGMSSPSYEKDNATWFRFISVQIVWKS